MSNIALIRRIKVFGERHRTKSVVCCHQWASYIVKVRLLIYIPSSPKAINTSYPALTCIGPSRGRTSCSCNNSCRMYELTSAVIVVQNLPSVDGRENVKSNI